MNKIVDFQKQHGLVLDGILGPQSFNKMKELWNINNEQLAHILGQCHHESMGFCQDEENLHYSYQRLLKIFPKYFKNKEEAKIYATHPLKIANHIYANRMGNGSESSGDGWNFRGRGAIQLTGRYSYGLFSDYIKEDCIKNPDLVKNKYFFESAIFFFKKTRILDTLCLKIDTESIIKVSKTINGGSNGLLERIRLTDQYYNQLKYENSQY
jgi:putative chitinase